MQKYAQYKYIRMYACSSECACFACFVICIKVWDSLLPSKCIQSMKNNYEYTSTIQFMQRLGQLPLNTQRKLVCHGPPPWSSGQSSWLQIQRSEFDYRRYHIFWEVVDLELGPLSLVSITEELLGRKSTGSGLLSREYGRRDPLRWLRGTLYPQKLSLTSLTSGGRSVGIVRSRTQAMEFFIRLSWNKLHNI
jgi:hypothetical protein